MAQAEDTELRDLVIEALEKNGSLAKIRALLRANIFLAFEDECENLKKNDTLDKVLQLPEGKFCLSIIHEFLEFCNLRNTLFVYKSESRQGREYHYDNVNIADKLNISKFDREKEPILLTLVKNCLKSGSKTSFSQSEKHSSIRRQCRAKTNYKDDQNSTYIVNEDSSTNTSHTQSDNSSDEKNKLDLRLTLDNSDTDTSSDSTRGQTRSEYIANKHIDVLSRKIKDSSKSVSEQPHQHPEIQTSYNYVTKSKEISEKCLRDLKIVNNSSTESTSYVELKPFNMLDTVLLNTTGFPFSDVKSDLKQPSHNSNSTSSKIESLTSNHTSNSNSESKQDNVSPHDSKASIKHSPIKSPKYDIEATEYSYDFTSPPLSDRKESSDKQSPRSGQQNVLTNKSNNTSIESNQHNLLSSRSSISLSDVADLISDRSSKRHSPNNIISPNRHRLSEKSNRSPIKDHVKILSDDSGDFSESPIPSLSNLSLDIHSD